MTNKNCLIALASISIGLFWASCKGTDPEPSPIAQTEQQLLSNSGSWKADTVRYYLENTVGGVTAPVESYTYENQDTMIFQPISTDTVVKPGFGGLRRGLLIRQHTAAGLTEVDTLNWQISPASLSDQTPRLVIFYNPGPEEVQYSFRFLERSNSKLILESEKALVVAGHPGKGYRKYQLSR